MNDIIREIEAAQLKENVDNFNVGDTVKVYGKIKEGLRSAGAEGTERSAEGSGGGPAPRGIFVLRGKQRGFAADYSLTGCGVEISPRAGGRFRRRGAENVRAAVRGEDAGACEFLRGP